MKVRKSAAPFYAVAVIWLAYALLFPLYRVSHFLIVGVISAVAFLLLTALCAKTGVPEAEKTEKAQEKPKEESTGNADLDKMLKDGRLAIAEMKRSNSGATSCGPGLASGWPWKLKATLSVRSIPCRVPSNSDL